jgi:hypothetical protein
MSNDREQWLQQRAYAIWEIEGRPDGRDREHWEKAERALSATQAIGQNASGSGASAAPIEESKGKKPRRTAPKPATSSASSRKKKSLELRP